MNKTKEYNFKEFKKEPKPKMNSFRDFDFSSKKSETNISNYMLSLFQSGNSNKHISNKSDFSCFGKPIKAENKKLNRYQSTSNLGNRDKSTIESQKLNRNKSCISLQKNNDNIQNIRENCINNINQFKSDIQKIEEGGFKSNQSLIDIKNAEVQKLEKSILNLQSKIRNIKLFENKKFVREGKASNVLTKTKDYYDRVNSRKDEHKISILEEKREVNNLNADKINSIKKETLAILNQCLLIDNENNIINENIQKINIKIEKIKKEIEKITKEKCYYSKLIYTVHGKIKDVSNSSKSILEEVHKFANAF